MSAFSSCDVSWMRVRFASFVWPPLQFQKRSDAVEALVGIVGPGSVNSFLKHDLHR